ncbi:MAG: NAD-dependent epimerase/dehydratase family protein [Alphaproteobacteria bacterium]
MKAAVTGAGGLIGANLVRCLLAAGDDVLAIARPSSDLAALGGVDVDIRRLALADADALAATLAGVDVLFHTAMHFTYDRRRERELDEALAATDSVLAAARRAGVGRVVLTSSSVVYGHSDRLAARDETAALAQDSDANAYVRAKVRQHARAFAQAEALGLDLVAACPTVTVGPHGTALGPSNGLVVAYLADPLRLTWPGGCNIAAAADVAAGHRLLALRGTPGAAYLLGGENLAWPQLHGLVAELAGVAPPRLSLTHGAAYLAAATEEAVARARRRRPLTTRDQAAMVGRWYWYDDARARALGYRPHPARAALAEAISWLAASPHVSREVRAGLRLHDDVYAVRHRGAAAALPAAGAA